MNDITSLLQPLQLTLWEDAIASVWTATPPVTPPATPPEAEKRRKEEEKERRNHEGKETGNETGKEKGNRKKHHYRYELGVTLRVWWGPTGVNLGIGSLSAFPA